MKVRRKHQMGNRSKISGNDHRQESDSQATRRLREQPSSHCTQTALPANQQELTSRRSKQTSHLQASHQTNLHLRLSSLRKHGKNTSSKTSSTAKQIPENRSQQIKI